MKGKLVLFHSYSFEQRPLLWSCYDVIFDYGYSLDDAVWTLSGGGGGSLINQLNGAV